MEHTNDDGIDPVDEYDDVAPEGDTSTVATGDGDAELFDDELSDTDEGSRSARPSSAAAANVVLHQKWLHALHQSQVCEQDERENWVRRAADAANDLVAANAGLVRALSRRFKMNGLGDDLDQAGFVGLWETIVGTNNPDPQVVLDDDGVYRLVGGWDPSRATLATACRAHVKGRLTRAVAANESRWQGASYGNFTDAPKVSAAAALLREELGTHPSAEQIAARAGVTVSVVHSVLTASPVSLNAPYGHSDDGSSRTLLDVVAASSQSGSSEAADLITQVLASSDLPVFDIAAFAVRHGLTARPPLPVLRTAAVVGAGRGATVLALKKVRRQLEASVVSAPETSTAGVEQEPLFQ